MHAGLMVPLAAAAAVLVLIYLRGRLRDDRSALWLALVYAFATPIFFRSAFINQNVLIAHATLAAYVLLTAHGHDRDAIEQTLNRRRVAGAGALLGFAVLCDYSGVPLAIAFGVWLLLTGWRYGGVRSALHATGWFAAGAIAPIGLLLTYQWVAFGNPILPAQNYMPPTRYSVLGWHGFFWPNAELMWRNLFDWRYGLFAFCPLLLLALAAPFVSPRPRGPSRRELTLIFGATAALYLFLCSVAFAFLQWNTGVRYLVPAVPLLFFACAPVLLRLPVWARAAVIVPTVAISWAVSMTRDAVPAALTRIMSDGVTLPWLSVLQRTASGYPSPLQGWASPIIVIIAVALLIWLIWRRHTLQGVTPSTVSDRTF
jgi:hypothetical protein